ALANFDFYPTNKPNIADMYFNEQQIIDLSSAFQNGTGSEITYEVFSNSNTLAVTATISGSDLILDSHEVMTYTDLTVKGTAAGKESYMNLNIETLDPNLFRNLYESFDESFEPMGWTIVTSGIGWGQTSDSHSGGFAAAHSYDEDPQNDYLYSPKMMITGNAILSFWEKTKYSSATGIHSVGTSQDLGRFNRVAYNIPHTSNWQQTYIDLSEFDGQEIYIGFNYEGADGDIWYVDDVRLWTTTGISNNPVIVNGNTLYQNYPNPFNPTTEIEFSLSKSSNVKLDVYNSNGEVVSSLVNNMLKKGSHNVSFNASELTGGIYFYKLNVDGRSLAKKMLLLK
ncbi:MAG: T9SS type A sorting domain-containing protein, partial [Candidatus Delongbacteria bacterium]|nr:T9SS type A sorting domain-containing protein [Candidatus Delongbacteria bacterium]